MQSFIAIACEFISISRLLNVFYLENSIRESLYNAKISFFFNQQSRERFRKG